MAGSAAISVLVADDDADLRLLLRMTLERAGFEVVEEAIDGADALDAVVRLSPPPIPTVMVLDNQMPGLTGFICKSNTVSFTAFCSCEDRRRSAVWKLSAMQNLMSLAYVRLSRA